MKTTLFMAVLTAAMLIVGGALNVAQAQQAGTKRTDLQRHDLSIPGYETVQARVDFAPGAAFPKHKHPGEEIIYVLEGSIEYDIEGKPPVTINAGGVLFIPAGVVHSAKNTGSVNAADNTPVNLRRETTILPPFDRHADESEFRRYAE